MSVLGLLWTNENKNEQAVRDTAGSLFGVPLLRPSSEVCRPCDEYFPQEPLRRKSCAIQLFYFRAREASGNLNFVASFLALLKSHTKLRGNDGSLIQDQRTA